MRTKDKVLNELVEKMKKIPKKDNICWDMGDCSECMGCAKAYCGNGIIELIDELFKIIKR